MGWRGNIQPEIRILFLHPSGPNYKTITVDWVRKLQRALETDTRWMLNCTCAKWPDCANHSSPNIVDVKSLFVFYRSVFNSAVFFLLVMTWIKAPWLQSITFLLNKWNDLHRIMASMVSKLLRWSLHLLCPEILVCIFQSLIRYSPILTYYHLFDTHFFRNRPVNGEVHRRICDPRAFWP